MGSDCTRFQITMSGGEQAIKKTREMENQIGVEEPIQKSDKVKRARERYDPWQMELKAVV